MNETGLVQIYCGDGKGKTTAAIGAAVRAAGRGYRVLVARLLKTDDSGEVNGLVHIPGITVLPCDQNFGFSWNMTQSQRKAAALYYDHCLLTAWNMALGAGGEEPYDMLVLDEATSSVDTRTEKLIELGMDRLMQDRTVFVIAHRLSTVRNAKAIMVLEHGNIIERGSHDELIAQRGRYYQLYTGQTELD